MLTSHLEFLATLGQVDRSGEGSKLFFGESLMLRSVLAKTAVLGSLALAGLPLAQAQEPRSTYSIWYYYDMRDPAHTLRFVEDVPLQTARQIWAETNINNSNFPLQGCPWNNPVKIEFMKNANYRNGTAKEEDVIRAVKQTITKQVEKIAPKPYIPIRSIAPVTVDPPRSEESTARGSGYTYNAKAPKLVGTWHAKDRAAVILTVTENQMNWMNQYVGPYTQTGNTFRAKLAQKSIPDAYVTMEGNLNGDQLHLKMIRHYNTSYGRRSDPFGEDDYVK